MIHAELMSEPRSWQGLRAALDGAFRRYGDPACARKRKPSHRPSPEQGEIGNGREIRRMPELSHPRVRHLHFLLRRLPPSILRLVRTSTRLPNYDI